MTGVPNEVIHPMYLPYSPAELAEHMPPAGASDTGRADRWLRHFIRSATNELVFRKANPDLRGRPVTELRTPLQIDKDERFWIATAMMRLLRHKESRSRLSSVLASIYGAQPPVGGSWEELLDGTIHLYFEALLPSPQGYKRWLADRIDTHPVRYIRDAARRPASDGIRSNLEGPTHVDAIVVVPETGFGLIVEAKALSDISVDVTFDPLRNQIVRNVDVMPETNERLPKPLSSRDPRFTFFLLVTPQIFLDHPTSRLYGWLMNEYRSDEAALRRDLPHRSIEELSGVGRRLGWTSFEAITALHPDACPWLVSLTSRTRMVKLTDHKRWIGLQFV